ncbi:hypothetical protein [Paraflavitalea speifideaquila]|uniref:hypothetical protein n=1 Tax=Paraflavitalea speifideaquila TaxID=3076558 RepID=UPI0028F10BA0|nr:hypothetical protein [Paraflavitalea speifideiaquila]
MYTIDTSPVCRTADLEDNILKVLAWFDLFSYPLTAPEVLFFLECTASAEDLEPALQYLVQEGLVFGQDGYYSLQQKAELVPRRIKGNKKAKQMLKTAHRIARLLYHFPYVRGVCISGSLSKHFADDNADIDFFIITSANRLWIARTMMHLFKKLTYLWGGQHWFCMNYYIDEEALLIREQNYFTAIELATLMPVCGNETIPQFFRENDWVQQYFPGYAGKTALYPDNNKGDWFKKLSEHIFNSRIGSRLEDYLMQLTTRRWKQKEDEQRLNMRGVRMGLSTGKHFSKPNPVFFNKASWSDTSKSWRQFGPDAPCCKQ